MTKNSLLLLLFGVILVNSVANIIQLNYFEKYLQVRNAIKLEQYKWPNGIIPYIFSDEYKDNDRIAVITAMEVFHNETCIQFIPKTNQTIEHIRFVKTNACGANIGYRRNQQIPLDVSYSQYCLKIKGAIQHELFHVVGLLHEQSRPDRDEHVRIYWENIDPSIQKTKKNTVNFNVIQCL